MLVISHHYLKRSLYLFKKKDDINGFFNDLFQQSIGSNSLNEFDDQSGGSGESQQPTMMNQNVYEFLSKVEKQNKLMRRIQFSDTYKDVVNSLLNENMSQSSKNYDRTESITSGKFNDGLEESMNYNYNPIRTERRNSIMFRPKKSLSNTMPLLIGRTNSIKHHSIAKINNEDFPITITEDLPASETSVVISKQVRQASIRPQTNKTVVLSARISSPGSSCFKSLSIKKRNKLLSSSNGVTTASTLMLSTTPISIRPSAFSRNPTRLTDFILNSSKRETTACSLDVNHEKSVNSFASDSTATNFDVENLLTPSFKVKRYNLKNERQLELAKADIFKRYDFANSPTVRGAISSRIVKFFGNKRAHSGSLIS